MPEYAAEKDIWDELEAAFGAVLDAHLAARVSGGDARMWMNYESALTDYRKVVQAAILTTARAVVAKNKGLNELARLSQAMGEYD